MLDKPSYEELERRVQELEQVERENKKSIQDLTAYRDIISSTPDGISLLDRDYRYIIVNEAYEKFSGVDRKNFIGRTVPEYLGREVFEQFIQPNFDKCLKGEIINYQEWFDYPTLGRRFVDITYSPYRNSNDQISGVIANTRDITEIRQAKEMLEELRHFYKLILDSVQEGIWVTDKDDRLIFFNPGMEKIAGIKAENMLGLSVIEDFKPETTKHFLQFYLDARTDGQPKSYEASVTTPAGRDTIQSGWLVPLVENGKYAGMICTIQDITQRKQAEKAQLENEEKFHLIARLAPVGIYLTTPDGKCLYVNEYWRNMAGLSLEEALGKGWINGIHPDDRQMVFDSWQKMVASQGSWGKEYRFQNKEEKTTWVYGLAAPQIGTDGKVLRYIGVNVDITQRKQAEEENTRLQSQLQQAAKMQALGTMAGGIAHEFNNLLGVIMGCTEMAREEVAQGSFVKAQLDNVIKASYRVTDLIKQILTFSRQSQRRNISIDLCSFIKESIELIKSSIPSSVAIQETILPFCGNILADPTEIQQILMNLFSNAVWATGEKGIIEICLQQVQLDTQKAHQLNILAGNYIELSFTDNGCGMDDITQARVFDPFFTRKEVGKGTGMGLSIVYTIMESYQGAITVESTRGKGTSFHLYFPVTDEPAAVEEKGDGAVEKIPQGRGRILFVDDEESYAEMGAKMISRLGYTVDLRTSSREALAAFADQPHNYDLVITDQIMPDLSGEELVLKMRALRPNIPIILCTGYSIKMDDKKADSLGINAFVYKPIAKKDIAELIQKVLNGT